MHCRSVAICSLHTTVSHVAGWFATAPFLGGFGKAAQDGYVRPAALTAAKCCAVATPVSLVLRGLLKGYPPPMPFIAVSFIVTGTLLIGWRSALAAATKPEVRLPSGAVPIVVQVVCNLCQAWF